MVELEADDALASAARIASARSGADKVCIWTPDKDLAQCVRDERACRSTAHRKNPRCGGGEAQVRCRAGLIADLLALVGDAAVGYPRHPPTSVR
jgi:5'-3' exonuclease